MIGFSANFLGPLDRRLWKRLRRRFRGRGVELAVATIAVYSLAATEPNYSGVWQGSTSDGRIEPLWNVRVYHIGNTLKGYHLDGRPRFEARFLSDGRAAGDLFLVRLTDPGSNSSTNECPPGSAQLVLTDDEPDNDGTLRARYRGNNINDDCTITDTFEVDVRLNRKT